MPTYEITEGRAPFTFEAPNSAVACVVTLILGSGSVGYRNMKDRDDFMPDFRIREAAGPWIRQKFGMGWDDLSKKVAQEHVIELEKAFESVRLGYPGDKNLDRPPTRHDLELKARHMGEAVVKALVQNMHRKKPH